MQRIVDKKADAKGTFNFVASDYGEHVICVSTSASAGWFSSASVVSEWEPQEDVNDFERS